MVLVINLISLNLDIIIIIIQMRLIFERSSLFDISKLEHTSDLNV